MASLQNEQIDQSFQGLIKTADNTSTIPFPPQMLQFGDGTTFPIQIADLSAFGAGTQIALKSGTNEIAVDTSGFVINAGGTMNAGAGTVTFNNGTYNFGDAGPATSVDFTNATVTDTVFAVKALETITDGGVAIKGDGTNAGKLKLYCEDASGAHNVTLEGPAHAGGATYSLKFPNVQSAGTQILEADASGNLAWINTPSGGGSAPSHPARYFGTGTLATTFEGPYTFFSNDIVFFAVYLNEGEEVSELAVEVGTTFTSTTTIGMALYDSQIGTSTNVEYVPNNKLLDLGTASPATAGVKTFTGSTYTATYSGTYYIALGYNGQWDGTFRQTDSQPRSFTTNNYYISTTTLGYARDFTPFEPILYSGYGGTMPASFAASQSFSNTSARLALMGKTEQNI